MTNSNLARIAAIDKQLAALEKMLRNPDNVRAAGLSLGLTLGAKDPDSDYTLEVEVGFLGDPVAILELVRASLLASRKRALSSAREELAELDAFLRKAL